MNIVVITGASSGIGEEFVHQLDRGLYQIDVFWLVARRKERLAALAKTLQHPVKILDLDLQKPGSAEKFADILKQEQPVIRMLINCAGFGMMGTFDSVDLNSQIGQIDLNCRALVAMTHSCLRYIRRKSRIIQVASSAGFLPQADFGVYAASKAFVIHFSMALRQELKDREIYVTTVCPGPVNTAFFDRAEKFGSTLAVKKLTIVEADKVVTDALRASAKNRTFAVYGIPIKALRIAAKCIPWTFMLEGADVLKKLQNKK